MQGCCLASCQLCCGSGAEHRRSDPALHNPAVGSCSFQGKRLGQNQRAGGGGHWQRLCPAGAQCPFPREHPRCPSIPPPCLTPNRAGASQRENRPFEAAPAAPRCPGRSRWRREAGSRRDTGAEGDARPAGRGTGRSPGPLWGVGVTPLLRALRCTHKRRVPPGQLVPRCSRSL